jgi:hypothetical protein
MWPTSSSASPTFVTSAWRQPKDETSFLDGICRPKTAVTHTSSSSSSLSTSGGSSFESIGFDDFGPQKDDLDMESFEVICWSGKNYPGISLSKTSGVGQFKEVL